jgi:general secretion pathway protein I
MRTRRTHGFTLLEVMAAVAILAIAFVVLMQAFGGVLRLGRDAAQRTQAVLWAQSKLDSAFVMQAPRPGTTQGHFDDRYRWRLAVRDWQPVGVASAADMGHASRPRLYRLDLDVRWGTGGHIHLATLRAANPHDATLAGAP